MSAAAADDLAATLSALGEQLGGTRLALELPGAPEARRRRDELAAQLGDYLLPRLRDLEAPLLVVVGGSTGAGKSTLVNSLLRADVTAAGVLRPTTRAPVLACHPDERRWFMGPRILPGLARVEERRAGGAAGAAGGGRPVLQVVPSSAVPAGMALLDAPDIDSVSAENRVLAAQLLAAADLWLFLTTAARYADAVPWEHLREARRRSTALAVVLNRVPEAARAEVPAHLGAMLELEGLAGTPVFTFGEAALGDGRLPESELAPLRRWLDGLGGDADTRRRVVRATLEGALASLPGRVGAVADAVDAEARALDGLEASARSSAQEAVRRVEEDLASGAMLRGEVLARWQEVVGGGDLLRGLERGVGRLRDRVRAAVSGRAAPTEETAGALAGGVRDVVLDAAEAAAARTVDAWSASPGGPDVLGSDAAALRRASPDLRARTAEEVARWQGAVLDLVRREGAGRRTTARVGSAAVNAAGVALMLAAFVHTGGLTGIEVAVAGGTATLTQKLLEAVFGEQAVRGLAQRAREDLLARVQGLLEGEAARFGRRVDELRADEGAAERLRTLAAVSAAAPW